MPKIELKPNSPEFADGKKAHVTRRCDMPGCACAGDHKAPKSRNENDYFWFCIDHVQEYNKAWDYFSGMSHSEVEAHIVRSALWDRPTRRFDSYSHMKEELYRKARSTYTGQEQPKDDPSEKYRKSQISRHSPEFEAMAIMGLEPPLNLETLKARYKELVKKYHPDINREDPKAEEVLKSVNMSYTILKMAYEKYSKIITKT